MGLDATGHYVPASTDAPARSAFDKLSRSLRDPFPVADAAARTALLVTLAAASPAVVPSTSSPIFFHQANLPAGYRTVYTVDGSNFISLSGAFVWADAAARTAATSMAAGDKGYQVDTKTEYLYSGSAWAANSARFCALRLNTNQNLTVSDAAIAWDAEISDPSAMHDLVTDPSRVTAIDAGLYEITASLYNGNTSGLGSAYARLNGATALPGSLDRGVASSAGVPLKVICTVNMGAGDYVEIMASHATAVGSISGGTNQFASTVTVKRIGPA